MAFSGEALQCLGHDLHPSEPQAKIRPPQLEPTRTKAPSLWPSCWHVREIHGLLIGFATPAGPVRCTRWTGQVNSVKHREEGSCTRRISLEALEDVRPSRGYPKNVELSSFVLSWRPIDWYRLASHPVRGKLQLWTIDAPERERPVGTRSLLGSAPVNSVRRRLRSRPVRCSPCAGQVNSVDRPAPALSEK